MLTSSSTISILLQYDFLRVPLDDILEHGERPGQEAHGCLSGLNTTPGELPAFLLR